MSKALVFRAVTVFLALGVLAMLGEIGARFAFPDTQLRYALDDELLFVLEADQVGHMTLANGRLTPDTTVNNLGLRGDAIDVNADTPTVLILGDSFSFGSGVEDDETFGARMAVALSNRWRVINGAQPGYGVYQMLAMDKRLSELTRTDISVMVVWEGDLTRQPPSAEKRREFFRQKRWARLIKRSVLATHLYRLTERLAANLGVTGLAMRVGDASVDASGTAAQERFAEYLAADRPRFAEFAGVVTSRGAIPILVFWPREGYARTHEEGLSVFISRGLSEIANSLGIEFVDLGAAFAGSTPDELIISGDGHPLGYTHCLVARTLLESIAVQGAEAHDPPACDH